MKWKRVARWGHVRCTVLHCCEKKEINIQFWNKNLRVFSLSLSPPTHKKRTCAFDWWKCSFHALSASNFIPLKTHSRKEFYRLNLSLILKRKTSWKIQLDYKNYILYLLEVLLILSVFEKTSAITLNRPAIPFGNRQIYFRGSFQSALSQFKKYHPLETWNLII